ncbi:pyridoxamine 5'-phosphate oxidase family protein [Jiangella mangrovi]|uniref:Putative pyridoxine 5'-phosphate oxidase superfamily flavin-nucleotide-binding protein n=1 Tax=Jiangella mangrovi TaxID=1524084 RepID=A0A7W9GT59_9ACTN|nr:pyridoxamine 5'-phosphate oxidase family protein [Jiangella mangrovi]MBB5789338.1 putative pyridoxine 5'-phosphate oxidase superfamily flavin-nucleotide-binding protein [Jiangella mangrovi]
MDHAADHAGQGRPGSAGEHALQEANGSRERADRFYREQMSDHLNGHMREFVGRMEMMFVGSADGGGECDVTFRAGPPGFVRVLDPRTIAWPEYRGNGVMASAGNILENAHVGLLFMDFVRDLVGLHVNGAAALLSPSEFAERHPEEPLDGDVPGRRPERWVAVHVDEAYIHCSKHVPRLMPVPRNREWGTDDRRAKGGDAFGVAAERGLGVYAKRAQRQAS